MACAAISSNRGQLLIADSIVPVFYGAMHAADATGPHGETWFVEADHINAAVRDRKKGARARHHEATSARAVIVSSMFLILFTSALLFGGHAAIDPLLRLASTANQSRSTGDVLMPMHDGKFCRHMTFDNTTAAMVEGTVEPCPDSLTKGEFRTLGRGFSWGEQ